ncbi:hypothetical protein ACUOFC_58705, partial [Escherichia sp. TWPC-MK]
QFTARLNELGLQFMQGARFWHVLDASCSCVSAAWLRLNPVHSALTQLHEASVTLIWRDSDERMAQFTARLNELGLQFMQGARFWHVLDAS